MSLKPTDLDPTRVPMDDTDYDPSDDGPLPPASVPPRPQDLRTKEGREWKKQFGHLDTGEPVKLEGAASAPPAGKPRGKRNVEHFRKVLLSMHEKAALLSGIPDVALDDDEATMLAEAISELMSYYNIKVSGKGGAALGVAWAATVVYGTRIAPYAMPALIEAIQAALQKLFGGGTGKKVVPENVIRPHFSI